MNEVNSHPFVMGDRKEKEAAWAWGRSSDGSQLCRIEHYLFIFLLLVTMVVMLLMQRLDYAWTLAIARHKIGWLSQVMGQSLFEGDLPGVSDVPAIFLGISVILYLIAWLRPQNRRLMRLRPYLGFILSSGLINAVLIVHGLKFALGRARPGLVFDNGWAYTNFYQFGPHYITEGFFRGSFPSGHTASVFTLMTIAYILIFDTRRSRLARFCGLGWALGVLGCCVLMGLARSMSLNHWVGDSLLMIFMGWLVMHVLYFWVLQLPTQISRGRYLTAAARPFLWELLICWWFWWIMVGLLALVTGLRAFQQGVPWLALLIPPGLLLLVYAVHRLCRLSEKCAPASARQRAPIHGS